jgi:hypothetical protein
LLWQFFYKIQEFFGPLLSMIKVMHKCWPKMRWATFWPFLSLTHLVTLRTTHINLKGWRFFFECNVSSIRLNFFLVFRTFWKLNKIVSSPKRGFFKTSILTPFSQ